MTFQNRCRIVAPFSEDLGFVQRTIQQDVLQGTAATVVNPAVGLLLREGMQRVAGKTGGDTIKAGDPGQAFQETMHRIRLRYSLYYAMPAAQPGHERQVKIELSADALQRFPKARVRSRKGYQVAAKS
jgi:hypothetical protein